MSLRREGMHAKWTGACKRLAYILLAMIVVAWLSGCGSSATKSGQPDANPRNVLPTAKQPTLPGSGGSEPKSAPALPQNTQGYPWSISYKQNDTDQDVAGTRNAIARYDIAILSSTWNVGEDIRHLAQAASQQIRIINVSPDTRPKGDRWTYPGHWLLYNGTRLTSDLAAIDGVTLVGVEDPTVFSVSNDDYSPDDVLIYALGENGQPDWSRSEEAAVVRVDVKNKMVTIKRAQYGSRPREFIAGSAVIASHATKGRKDSSSWVVNISRTSPVAPSGARGAESMARLISAEFRRIMPAPHGLQLESSQWEVYAGSSNQRRGPDTDNDLKADWGYTYVQNAGLVNTWGLGSADLVRYLRSGGKGFEGLGQGTGIWVGHSSPQGSRATPQASGIAYESFDEDARAGFSAAYQRLSSLSAQSGVEPRMSYVLVNTPTRAFSRSSAKPEDNSAYRLGLGTALLQGFAFGYASAEPGNRASLGWAKDYYLDEYDAGAAVEPHYLGKPLGPAVRLPGTVKREDLLGGSGKNASGWKASGAASSMAITDSMQAPKEPGNSVQFGSAGRQAAETASSFEVKPQTAYTIVFSAKAQNHYGNIDGSYSSIPSAVEISLSNAQVTAQTITIGQQWSSQNITFYTGKTASGAKSTVMIKPQDPGTIWIQDLEVREGTSDVLYRIFDGGIVLVNGSPSSVQIEMDMVAPGMKFRAIDGKQDPEVNNGKPVGTTIVVPAHDARILVK